MHPKRKRRWNFPLLVVVLFFFLNNASPLRAQNTSKATAVTHATVIDGNGGAPLKDATVIVRDGKISCVGDCELTQDMQVIDATGKYLIPGLVDAHVHYMGNGWIDTFPGVFEVDVSDQYPFAEVLADLQEHPERFHRSYLCSGVTAVFDIGGYTWSFDVREDARNSTSAPHYAATGPLMTMKTAIFEHPAAKNLSVQMKDEQAIREGIKMLATYKADAIKLHALDVAKTEEELKNRLKVVKEEANKAGLRLMANAPTLESAKAALRAGTSMLVYSIEDKVVDQEFLDLARQNKLIYVPTIAVSQGFAAVAARAFPQDRIPLNCVDSKTREKVLLTESLPKAEKKIAAAPKDGERTVAPGQGADKAAVRAENLRRIKEAGITIATGSSAGAPLTLHGPGTANEMEAMVQAGLTPMEVLVASTRNGAKAMGREDFGTIEEGKIADLVLLSENPIDDILNVRMIELVMRGGKVWDAD